jgi:cellulose synthase/poly-beta-1,6-N-acetylglucosamine synthase-like glycosyltransferase
MIYIFYACFTCIIYVYILYPILLSIVASGNTKMDIMNQLKSDPPQPPVSMIISAYNEEQDIAAKLNNTLKLISPGPSLEIMVASDGSTDNTNAIVKSFKNNNVKLMSFSQNRGKAAVQQDAISKAGGQIIVLSDATGAYTNDALVHLIKHFSNDKIGVVAGLVSFENMGSTSNSRNEGIYWKYECFIRNMESKLGILTATSGSILAFRKSLFQGLDPAVSDDFMIPMQALSQGYHCILEPKAVSAEKLVETEKEEFYVKARTITLDIRGLFQMKHLLNPFKYPLVSWSLISHKLLRWSVPFFLIGLFLSGLCMLDVPFYRTLFKIQIYFYVCALTGYLFKYKNRIFSLPYFFCMINTAAVIGFYRNIKGAHAATWKPVR